MMIGDPLFTVPFLSGLLVAAVLSAVGVLLRLRNEWLAALGFAHLAGASALIGLAIHMPVVLGATFGATIGAVIKTSGEPVFFTKRWNPHWAVGRFWRSVLIAGNTS